MLKILEILDREAPSGNAIFLFEVDTGKVLGGNLEANDLFSTKHNVFDLKKIFGDSLPMESLMQRITIKLDEQKITSIDDVEVVCKKNEVHRCSLDFTYLTDERKGIIMIVKIKEDFRGIFLEMLLSNSKRPAFLLEYATDDLVIRNGNDTFYQAFVCTRDNIEEKYESRLENLLSEEDRERYMSDILTGIQGGSSGILQVPLRTARGETLLFYYSKKLIKPLIDEEDKCLFCLLVGTGETQEEVECPYDN
ncbi:MAG: hypothetical protein R3Y63_12140 [Eubacteriales bacterium]